MHPDVDVFIDNAKNWKDEFRALRAILLDCGLEEDFKWRSPCYTVEGSNVIILAGLKDRCTLSFFKGSLLKDPKKILVKPGPNSRSAMLVPFTSIEEIVRLEKTLKSYIREAIKVEQAGLKVDFEKNREIAIPEELQQRMDEMPALQTAFDALTPGRRRGYLIHFTGAKQSKARASRVDKAMSRILDGKGLNDCICGLSKRYPSCDGSHKHAK